MIQADSLLQIELAITAADLHPDVEKILTKMKVPDLKDLEREMTSSRGLPW